LAPFRMELLWCGALKMELSGVVPFGVEPYEVEPLRLEPLREELFRV
jgi:hypothetical protein